MVPKCKLSLLRCHGNLLQMFKPSHDSEPLGLLIHIDLKAELKPQKQYES